MMAEQRGLPHSRNYKYENAPGQNPGSMIVRKLSSPWTLMKLGNFSFPFATSDGQTLTCLPSCHCSIRPVIRPLPYFRPWVNSSSLAVELSAADGTFPVGLFPSASTQFVRIGRTGAL